MAIYRLGVVSDLHCLSRYGLVPPDFRPAAPLPSSTLHGYLWDCWVNFCRDCPPLDALIVNGDLIEGENPSKRDAMDAISDDPNLQGDAAFAALSLIRPKVKHLWIVRGTPYHEGKYFETVERVAYELKAEPWAHRRYTGFVLEGDFYGLKINATHHVTIGAIYRGTIADRTMQMATACERLQKTVEANVIIRSHIHSTHLSHAFGKWMLVTRCWKAINPYAVKRMEFYRASLLNDLGGHILETDGHGSIAWKDIAYDPPHFGTRDLAGSPDLATVRSVAGGTAGGETATRRSWGDDAGTGPRQKREPKRHREAASAAVRRR